MHLFGLTSSIQLQSSSLLLCTGTVYAKHPVALHSSITWGTRSPPYSFAAELEHLGILYS